MASSPRDIAAPRTGLIGREHPSVTLRSAIERTTQSHGGLVLIAGEAGVGKTSLATAAVEEAHRKGVLVLSGSCWDSDGVPDLWPWIQVARALRRLDPGQGRPRADALAWEGLTVLLGESTGAQWSGFALFDALATSLVSVARGRPTLVVLEDLHWADTASLELLDFVAQHTWFEQVLVVGTYRDAEVEAEEHPLQGHLASLATRATTIALTGLSAQDTGALIERTTGRLPDGATVREVQRWTGGNPFFVEQAARLWHGGGAITSLAPGVREAVQRRLALLPEAVRAVLTTAALLGREFHRHVLAAVLREPDARVDRLLDQAAVAKLVGIQGGGQCVFAHDLVRETLEVGLSDDDRREGHAAVVDAAERSPRIDALLTPTELARHAYLAGDRLEAERAVGAICRAAEDAGRRLAAGEGVRLYRRALERAEPLALRRRVLIMLELSRALRRHGDDAAAQREYARAVDLARQAAEPALFARTVLVFPDAYVTERFEVWRELVAEAHGVLLPAGAPRGESPENQARELVEDLVRRARQEGDAEELTFAMLALHSSTWGPGGAQERLVLSRELERLADGGGDSGLAFIATGLQWVAMLELGDPRYLEQFHRFADRAAKDGAPQPLLFSQVDHAVVAGFLGDFEEAETALGEAQRVWTEFGGGEVGLPMLHRHEEWGLLLLQGRYDELARLHREAAQRRDPLAGVQQAITAAQRGEIAAARAFLTDHRAEEHPLAAAAPLWLRLRAQVAAATGDPEMCERARKDLAPYSGEWLVSMFGYEIGGPADLWLGRIAAAERRWGPAVEHLHAACDSARAMRSRPWRVEARLALAGVLLDREGEGDREAALAVLDEVEGESSGMRHVPARLAVLRERATAAGAGSPADEDNEFRFEAGTWSLRFAGRAVHMPDAKGLRDLHFLLSSPGVDVPAVRLVNPAGGPESETAARMGGDQVLDERAKAEFRRRLGELDALIEEASALGQDDSAAAHDRERAALLEELRAAAGLGGRTRRLGDGAERARKTVTARIRDTLGRLDGRHPELAAHLREAVATGTHCSYRPEAEIRWRL